MKQISLKAIAVAPIHAMLLLASAALCMMAARPGIAQDAAVATTPSLRITADFALSIDGNAVVGTSSHATDANGWQGEFSGQDMAPNSQSASGGVILINKPGESFVVRAQRGAETWELDCRTTPLPDGTIEMRVVARHNAGVVSEQRKIAIAGEAGSLQIHADPDQTNAKPDLLQLAYTLRRIDASALPANRAKAFKQASINVTPNGAGTQPAGSEAGQGHPSEIAASRRMRPPRYPPSAVRAGVQGKVVVNVMVGADGIPKSAEVFGIEPASAVELGGAAVAAALQWRYNPALRAGKPVGASLFVPVDFFLQPDKGERIPEPDPLRSVPLSYRKLTLPGYPASAIQNRIAGSVFVRAEIAADGSLTAARVEQVTPDTAAELGEAALAAVKNWQFAPEMVAGAPRASVARIPIEFRTEPDTAPAAAVQAALEPVANTLQKIVVTPP